MDYEFLTDTVDRPIARLSMDHEALGNWLTWELGSNPANLANVLSALEQLQTRKIWEFEQQGAEFNLQLTREEARVQANSMFQDGAELADDIDFYDSEAQAHCGLDDFSALIKAWCEFVGYRP